MESNFVHLNLHTEYSLSDGVSNIDKYLAKAKLLGMKSLAITDSSNMFGALEFYKKAKKNDIKAILGLEIYLYENFETNYSDFYNEKNTLILLAKNNEGYRNLLKLSSEAYRNVYRNIPRLTKEILKKYSAGLVCFSSSLDGEIPRSILRNISDKNSEEKTKNIIEEYISIFGIENFYLEIQMNELEEQKILNEKLFLLAEKYKYNLVVTNNVHYTEKYEYNLQDIIICIQNGNKIKEQNRERIKSKELYFKSKKEILDSFNLEDRFFKFFLQAVENTNYIADLCNVDIKFGELQFPNYDFPKEYKSMDEYLKAICYTNIKEIYGETLSDNILERLEYELSVIFKMGYSSYFIVVWDFITYAKRRGIPIGPGRGSAAGSLVAYSLGITMVDPIKYNLLFERFLNPERISMPDIDIDICRERREEVIDYVIHKYGREKVAHIITFGRMKARAAIRDAGRVLDVDLKKIDKLSKLVPHNISLKETLKENVEVAKLYTTDIELQKVIDVSIQLENKARHTSIHAAGILVTKDNLDETIPIYLDEKEGLVCTQYQMKELEELGLLKMDFLGLKNLTNVQRTLDFIKAAENIDIDLYKIPFDDREVYKMLGKGDTLGVFQMESYGLRQILRRLKPDKFDDVIALLSLYRPGPLQSGMVDDFINCKNGLSKIKYPDKSLENILRETYGVILYQEQVMKIANLMADYSLAEADLLRRAMGKKDFRIMEQNKEKFTSRAIKNGYSLEKAEEVFSLIDKFAGYGFNKSHSVAYSFIAYWTAYLKVNYSKYYFSSILTAEIYESKDIEHYFKDAKAHGVKIYAPNVNNPSSNFSVKDDGMLFSLSAIKNIGMNISKKIELDYLENGKYKSFENFVSRNKNNGLNKRSLEALILSGALDELNGNRKEKFLSIDKILEFSSKVSQVDEIQQMNLFGEAVKIIDSFNMIISEDFSIDEKLEKEKEFLGFYLSSHPLDKYKNMASIFALEKLENCSLEEHKKIETFGNIKNLKKIMTKKEKQMALFTLNCYEKEISCVVFPNVYEKYLDVLKEKNSVFIQGKLQIDKFQERATKKIIISKIVDLNDLYLFKWWKLYILIEEEDRDKYSSLKEIIKANKTLSKDGTKVFFAIKNKTVKKLSDTRIKVNLTKSFVEDLIDLIGSEKIKIN